MREKEKSRGVDSVRNIQAKKRVDFFEEKKGKKTKTGKEGNEATNGQNKNKAGKQLFFSYRYLNRLLPRRCIIVSVFIYIKANHMSN